MMNQKEQNHKDPCNYIFKFFFFCNFIHITTHVFEHTTQLWSPNLEKDSFVSGSVSPDCILKVGVRDWPLNIYTYNSCQKEFSKDICKILQSCMCDYFNLKDALQDQKFPKKSMGIYKLYLRNSELISNFSTVKIFKIHYLIINISVNLKQE